MKSNSNWKINQVWEDRILFLAPILLLLIFSLQTNRPLIRKFGIHDFSFWNSLLVFSALALINLLISYVSIYILKRKGSAAIFAVFISWVALYYGFFIKFLKSFSNDFLLNTLLSISYQKILIVLIIIGIFGILKFYKKDIRVFALFICYSTTFFLFTEIYYTAKEIFSEKSISINSPTLSNQDIGESKPDIYYFICDAYTSNASLRAFDFNNVVFKNALHKRGFYITENSKSNYPITYPSIASSLNMGYTSLEKDELLRYSQISLLKNFIRTNVLFDFLAKHSYQIVSLSHLFPNTILPPLIRRDRVYYYWETTKSSIYYTFISRVLDMFSSLKESKWNSQFESYAYSTNLPDKIDSVVEHSTGPKFVYAHFMATHPPYVFDSTSKFQFHADDKPLATEYIAQVKILNKQLLSIIDRILEKNRSNSVIIIQADHGSHLLSVEETFTIQNNYYFPDQNYEELYQSITPVNSFRIILNKYFNQDLPILEDKTIRVSY